jgi:hypothetical protein
MKNLLIIVILLGSFIFVNCKKQSDNLIDTTLAPIPTKTGGKWDIQMNAGEDFIVQLPKSDTILSGRYHHSGFFTRMLNTTWTQISGPDSCDIITPSNMQTVIRNLKRGVYEFELKGYSQNLKIKSDTVQVTVLPKMELLPFIPIEIISTPGEIIAKNLNWFFPWYPTLAIASFYTLSPDLKPGVPYQVFIQRNSSKVWQMVEKAQPDSTTSNEYEYFYNESSHSFYIPGVLYIFYSGWDYSDRPSIKILY